MKRPLCVVGAALLLAIGVAFLLPFSGLIPLSAAIFLTALVPLLLKKEKAIPLVVFLLSLALGIALNAFYQYRGTIPFLERAGQTVVVEGVVEEVAQSSARSVRYTLSATFPKENLPNTKLVVRDYLASGVEAGEKISAVVVLSLPTYENTASYYRREGIPLEGVLQEEPTFLEPQGWERLTVGIIQAREAIKIKVQSVLPKESGALVNGMVFGMTEELDASTYTDLNRSGTSHLVSVSGLHLSIVTAFILWMLSKSKLPLKAQYLLAMVGNISFTLLVGCSPPIVRSCVMSLLFLMGKMIEKESDSLNALGFAAIVIALFRPYWALSRGMWLSFCATIGIILVGTKLAEFLTKRYRQKGRWANKLSQVVMTSLGITLGAYLFTLPILVATSGWISLLSPLANLLVLPFTSIVVVGGLFIAFLPSGFLFYPLLLWVVHFSSRMILEVSGIIGHLPFGLFSLDHPALVVAFFLAMAVCVLFFLRKDRKKWIATGLVLTVLLLSLGEVVATVSESNQIQVITLGAEQSKVLIRGNNAVVIGTPDKYSVEGLINYLQFRGVSTIDALVIPDHPDQIGSALYRLEEEFPIESILGPNDAYLLEELATALEGVPVYSSGYATLSALGGVQLFCDTKGKEVSLLVGRQKIKITTEKYDIISEEDRRTILFYGDGQQYLPPNRGSLWNPLTEQIYGEERILIPL